MPDNRQLEILDDLLKTAERNFEATVKHAATVDDKAQKTSGLAGVFLAVAFGFIKPESLTALQQRYGDVSLGLLYAALILFVASVALCLRAMWLRKVPAGGVSLASQEMSARFLLQLPIEDLDDEMMGAYKDNQIEIWKFAIEERFTANVEKTRLVHYAQRTLAGGIFVAAVSLGLLGYAARNAIPSKQEKSMPDQKNPPGSEKPSINPAGAFGPVRVTEQQVIYIGHETDERPSDDTTRVARRSVLQKLKSKDFIDQQIASLDRVP